MFVVRKYGHFDREGFFFCCILVVYFHRLVVRGEVKQTKQKRLGCFRAWNICVLNGVAGSRVVAVMLNINASP